MFDGFWYRCEIKRYSIADEWGDHSYTSSEIVWTKYAIVRETPKGVWLTRVKHSYQYSHGRFATAMMGTDFVLGTSLRQLACPTKELALADAIARKKRHVSGCHVRLVVAQDELIQLKMELERFNSKALEPAP